MENSVKSSNLNNFTNIKTNAMKNHKAHLFMLTYHSMKLERVYSKIIFYLFFPFE